MKITDVKNYPVWIGHRNQMLVKVETDEGIYGWGESGFSSRELAVSGMVDHFREFLVGRDPMQRGRIWQEMYRGQYFEGGRTITGAISAIDIAPARHRRQEARSAGLRTPRRQATRLGADLRIGWRFDGGRGG